MEPQLASRWRRVAEGSRHGRVHVEQLHALGLSKGAIDKAVASGRLHREHRGVYVLGYPGAGGRLGRWTGAVLACGDGAVLSGRSAATLWRIRDGEGPRVDVTVPGTAGRRRPGIAIHRAALPPQERTEHRGVPVVSVARLLVELSRIVDGDELQRAIREAQYQRLFVRDEVEAALRRRPSRRLAVLLEDLTPVDSPLGEAFLRIVRRHALPRPAGQAQVEGRRVDFVWQAQRVVVELDGGRAHRTDDAFQRDRSNTNALQLAGYVVLRFTWADVTRRPGHVARSVRDALWRSGVPMEP